MALQSQVDACNSALQKLGAASIISLTDNSPEARQCSLAYDSNRRSELRKHKWNFAIKRVVLAPDVTAPAFDFKYQFSLPSDCLRLLLPSDITLDWAVEGRKILTNDGTSIKIRYLADITDLSQWDPIFYDMFSISLALDMCEPLTNSTAKRQALEQDYKETLREARRNNAFEQTPADPPDDDFWLVRL